MTDTYTYDYKIIKESEVKSDSNLNVHVLEHFLIMIQNNLIIMTDDPLVVTTCKNLDYDYPIIWCGEKIDQFKIDKYAEQSEFIRGPIFDELLETGIGLALINISDRIINRFNRTRSGCSATFIETVFVSTLPIIKNYMEIKKKLVTLELFATNFNEAKIEFVKDSDELGFQYYNIFHTMCVQDNSWGIKLIDMFSDDKHTCNNNCFRCSVTPRLLHILIEQQNHQCDNRRCQKCHKNKRLQL